MREDDALFGEWINSLHERYGDQWEEVAGGFDAFMEHLGGDDVVEVFGNRGPLSIMEVLKTRAFFDERRKRLMTLPTIMCADCLQGCHLHCEGEVCECQDSSHL